MTSSSEFPPIPDGLQRLLRLASVDPSFRDELARRPLEVAQVAGITLTATERAVLAALPPRRLREMAEGLPPPPPPRRERLRRTAATAVVLLGGAALAGTLAGCPDKRPDPGAIPEPPPPAAADWDADDDSSGADPGTPPVRTTTLPAIGGARSDMPPEDCE